jgi:hypothetical protein
MIPTAHAQALTVQVEQRRIRKPTRWFRRGLDLRAHLEILVTTPSSASIFEAAIVAT